MISSWQLTMAASIGLLGIGQIAHAAEWTPVRTSTSTEKTGSSIEPIRWIPLEAKPSSSPVQPRWQILKSAPENVLPKSLIWTPLTENMVTDIEEKIEKGAPIENEANAAISIEPPVMPSGTTFANDKAIWRDEEWHPQISGSVPVGFGPKGLMISTSIWAIDCVTGAGYCATTSSFDEYLDQVERIGEAQYNLSIGFGDTEKLAGLTITSRFEETSLKLGNRNENENKNLFSNFYVGAHLSRSFSPDTAMKVGIDNWADFRECLTCGFAKSAYGVISQRFRLRKNQNVFFLIST